MSLWAIKFIGRWASDVVEAYVENAIEGQACLDALGEKEVKTNGDKVNGDLYGGVRAASRSTVVHAVLIGEVAFPLEIWVTRCGWHFGFTRHLRTMFGGWGVWCGRCGGGCGLCRHTVWDTHSSQKEARG
eukprot:2418005-Amphidinium_carterae.1